MSSGVAATATAPAASAATTVATSTSSAAAIAASAAASSVAPALFLELGQLVDALTDVPGGGLPGPDHILLEGLDLVIGHIEDDPLAAQEHAHVADGVGHFGDLASQDAPDVARTLDLLEHLELVGGHVLAAREQRAVVDLLEVARHERQRLAQRLLRADVGDDFVGDVLEEGQHVVRHLLERGVDVAGGGSDDVLALGGADLLEGHACAVLDELQLALLLGGVEGDAGAGLAGAGGAARAVDVGLVVLGGLGLHDEVYVGDVESAGGHVGGDQGLEGALAEALHRDLALGLGDVAVQHVDVELDVSVLEQLVGLGLGLREHDGFLILAAVAEQHVGDGGGPVVVGTADGEVAHGGGGLVLEVAHEVDVVVVGVEVVAGDALHPVGDRRRVEHDLELLGGAAALALRVVEDRLHVLLEAHVEHLVGLVQHERLDVGQADVAPLDVVLHAPHRAHQHVDAVAEGALLPVVGYAAVDGGHVVLRLEVLERDELVGHLDGELARGRQHHHLGRAGAPELLLRAQALDEGQREAEGLAGAGERAPDDVLGLEGGVEGGGLDGEEVGDAPLVEERDRVRGQVEALEGPGLLLIFALLLLSYRRGVLSRRRLLRPGPASAAPAPAAVCAWGPAAVPIERVARSRPVVPPPFL